MTKYLSLVGSIIFCAAALMALVYVYLDIQNAISNITTARTSIAAIGARDSFAKAAAQFLAETGKERAAVDSLTVLGDQTANAIVLVEEAAKLAGVKATVSAATIDHGDSKYLESLAISVSADGPLKAQANFATVLESLPKGAYVKDVHLESADKGWFGTYTILFSKEVAP